MEWLLFAVALGCIPGAIAQGKGHSFVGWWIYGALLFIVALPHSLMLRRAAPEPMSVRVVPPETPSTPRGAIRVPLPTAAPPPPKLKTCPMCAEEVQAAARICRFCRHEFAPAAEVEPETPTASAPKRPGHVPFGMKACPSCQEHNWHDAITCKKCGTTFALAKH
jgi:hypothetical protein